MTDGFRMRRYGAVWGAALAAIAVIVGSSASPVSATASSGTPPVVQRGAELPGGGTRIFEGKTYVALYGHPGTGALGVLGEQGTAATIRRAKKVAASYRPHTARRVVPALEIIATIASRSAGRDGDYSSESSVAKLRPLVDAAGRAGTYVVLDLQPGRSTFLSQAKRYRALLLEPHVGLALDPEWRLKPGQRHLRQIGSVRASEINDVARWLADLTRDAGLPQKMLLLHQFRTSMITNRSSLDTSRDELALVIQMDGLGSQPAKRATWRALRKDAPEGIVFGWKNFIDEDRPMLGPKATMAISPEPRWVSFQ
ncbi:MAG TPA: hypothetical protein VES03_08320 [Motilibacterales bacterium]|nr:hypothetical protein [Motilibacterales bacterium]